MKKRSKRAVALLLTLAMCLSLMPAGAAFAAEEEFERVTSQGAIDEGYYVLGMERSDGYIAAGGQDSRSAAWGGVVDIATDGDSLLASIGDDITWYVRINAGEISLQHPDGYYMACSQTGNGIQFAEDPFYWQYDFDSDGNTVKLYCDGTYNNAATLYYLALNVDNSGFRAYRESTAAGYPHDFALFKHTGNAPAPVVTVAKPTASPAGGAVEAGTKVALSTATDGAEIHYTTDGSEPDETSTKYTAPIEITEAVTIKAVAVDPSGVMADSDTVVFNYTIRSVSRSHLIENVLEGNDHGGINIGQAFGTAVTEPAQVVSVIGQIAYRYGNYDSANTAIIQDIVDGEVVALQVFNDLSRCNIGDVVLVTGGYSPYGNVPQLSLQSVEVLKPANEISLLPHQELTSLAYVQDNLEDLLSEVVRIKDVTLGTYNSDGSTKIMDGDGVSMDIYRAATYPYGVSAGDVVDVIAVVSKYNNTKQLRVGPASANGNQSSYVVTNDIIPPFITLPTSHRAAQVGVDYGISVAVVDNVGVKDVKVSYKLNDGVYSTPEAMSLDQGSGGYEYTIPGSVLTTDVTSLQYKIDAVDVNDLSSSQESPVIEVVNEPVVKSVTPKGGSATEGDKRPEISIIYENGSSDVKFTLTSRDGTVVIPETAMTVTAEGDVLTAVYAKSNYTDNLADGRYTVNVKIGTYEHSWYFTVGEAQYTAYFGQLHAHTAEYSDGAGTLAQALDYIKNIGNQDNVQFVAFTDHSNYFDTTSAANPPEALYDITQMTAASRATWEKYIGDMRDFNEENNDILAIPGFEMTWSGGPGHMNTFNSNGLVSRNNPELNNKTNDAGMQEYYKLLTHEENAATVSQLNHPGTTFGTFADFAYWTPGYDKMINLIEVGNGAGAVGSSAYFPSYEYYVQALDKGWHLAPTNNQDNHSANWGNANTARSVIITDEFSEEGMLEGMRNMTMYSTEDKNLEIMYTVNGEIMGSVINDDQEKVCFDAQINDPDGESIGTVEIVVNGGRVIYQEEYSESSIDISAELDPNYSYYFLRVIQPDKDIAVTAPVWIGEVVKIGITEMTTETIMPVKAEELAFTTKMYNYEDSLMVINKLEYTISHLNRDTVIASYDNLGNIPAGTNEWTHTQKFTPESLGFMTLTVKMDATLAGTAYNFETSYKFEVLDPDNLVSIAVDGGHGNFYVSGDYADSDTGLMELGAKSGIRVMRLMSGELTYENLKDKELLILTVPYLGVSNNVGTPVTQYLYTQNELDAIAQYAENGGNIIVCSKSDRLEPAADNERAHVISNGILSAIGAKARVAEGIVIDNVRKSNELYRITLGGDSAEDRSCFNYAGMKSSELVAKFLKDVEETTNNTFSVYNSAPIIANGAEPLVSGFPNTTWSTHFNELPSNSTLPANPTEVTKVGETHLMTVEQLDGGGFLIVSGVTFFSTFEVQVELDYAGQLQNTNYQILYNIFDQIAPEAIITDIDKVHAAEEGLPFTIEGIATSNASGYDRDTAFFDCIYVQDETAGINVFPVAENIQAGQTLRISGYTSSYEGERQLEVKNVQIIDSSIKTVEPVSITTKQAAEGDYMGSLVKVTGTVTNFTQTNGVVETILLRDSSGVEARVFINGYITAEKEIKNLAVGATFEAVGLGSADLDGNRIRVRNRDEVVQVSSGSSGGSRNNNNNPSTTTPPATDGPGENVTYKPEAKVEDGVATVTVDSKTAADLISSAVDNNSAEIIISPIVSGEAYKVEVTVPKTLLSEAASRTEADVVVESDIATVKLPNGVLGEIAKESGSDVTVSMEQTESETVKIQVAVGDKELAAIGDGIIATMPAGTDPGAVAVLVYADGTEEIIVKSALTGGDISMILAGSAEIKIIENAKTFVDLPASHWAYGSAAFASSRNLFQGVGEDRFAPDTSMTRGMLVTVLHRLENEEETSSTASFVDVASGAWYAKAVSWASGSGIVAGVGDNSFAPEQPVTRSELVTMLYRYAQAAGLDLNTEGSLTRFDDAEDVPDWAEAAFTWAAGVGIVSGNERGQLSPASSATRAEVSSILERMVKLMVQ